MAMVRKKGKRGERDKGKGKKRRKEKKRTKGKGQKRRNGQRLRGK